MRLEDVVKLKEDELDRLFTKESWTPSWHNLNGYEFRGYNIGAGFNLSVLTNFLKKFKKGFFEKDGVRMGYNIPVKQNSIDEPWIAKPTDKNPKRFGFFTVEHVDFKSVDNKFPHALLLDYGKGGNGLFGPPLRDYLVQVCGDVYLGYAYLALGKSRIGLSYFVLERHRKSDFCLK